MLLALACCVHLLYVAGDSTVFIYDIDRGHRLVREVHPPGAGDFKGIGASPTVGLLFLASHRRDELIAVSLATDSIAWRRRLPPGRRCFGELPGAARCGYVDSFALSPDGRTLYVPMRREDAWNVVDAADGRLRGRITVTHGPGYRDYIDVGVGPHNTAVDATGRVYMEVLTDPYVYVADPRSLRLVGRIGPFARGVRPFAITAQGTRVFANVDGILGFEMARLAQGQRTLALTEADARVPPERLRAIGRLPPPAAQPHGTPSHGIALSPNGREAWIADGVYGCLHVFDVSGAVPRQLGSVLLAARADPSWVTIGTTGRFVYSNDGSVVDAVTRRVVAHVRSGRAIEVDP